MTIWTQADARRWTAALDGVEYVLTHRGGRWWLLCGEVVLRHYTGQMAEGEALEVAELDASRVAYATEQYRNACQEGR